MRSQLKCFGHLLRMPPRNLPGEVIAACPSGRRPCGRPQLLTGEIKSLDWPGNVLISSRRSWWRWLGRGVLGFPAETAVPHDPDPHFKHISKQMNRVFPCDCTNHNHQNKTKKKPTILHLLCNIYRICARTKSIGRIVENRVALGQTGP